MHKLTSGGLVAFCDRIREDTLMFRFLILIIVFVVTIYSVPQIGSVQPLLLWLSKVPSQTALYISIGALILGGGATYIISRQPDGLIHAHPTPMIRIVASAGLGLTLAALFDIFEALSGYAITPVSLFLVTLAFTLSEIIYLILLGLWRLARPNEETHIMPQEDEADSASVGGVPRLLVTLPVYSFVLVFLPQQHDFKRLLAEINTAAPIMTFWASLAALIIAAGLALGFPAYLERVKAGQATATQDEDAKELGARQQALSEVKFAIVVAFAIGLVLSGAINVIAYLLSFPISPDQLLLMPLGLVSGEILFQLIDWRIKYGPPQ